MNYYEIWCDLKDTSKDLEFCDAIDGWLGHLKDKGLLEDYKVRRRKLGFAPDDWREFNVSIAFRDLAQLDAAFSQAATRDADIEPRHAAVYRLICNGRFALYRDFPDAERVR